MNQLTWNIVLHSDLSDREIEQIATLKDEYWPHGIDSQIRWIKVNICADDCHLLARAPDGKLLAYLAFVNVGVNINDISNIMIGIGNVCVEKSIKHSGYGKALIHKASDYIESRDSLGILLCKDDVVPFYFKCGWVKIQYNKAIVAGGEFTNNIMMNRPLSVLNSSFEIMREF